MEITALLREVAGKHGLDPQLIVAIATVESTLNPFACRFEQGYPYLFDPKGMALISGVTLNTEQMLQRCSWGLMQVMGATARELGFRAPLPALTDPLSGAEFGCLYLKRQLARYKGKVSDAVAAYNAGSARLKSDGSYENAEYVTKVMFAKGKLSAA